MADYTKKIETAERIVIRLKLPTNTVEMHKAILSADKVAESIADRDNKTHLFDDAVKVEADEEELRFIITSREWS